MEIDERFVTFLVNGKHYALPLDRVQRVIRVLQITPVPEVADYILGVINVHGQVMPVLDLAIRFGGQPHPIALSDQLVIFSVNQQSVALVAEKVMDVLLIASDYRQPTTSLSPDDIAVQSVIRQGNQLILALDADKLVSDFLLKKTVNESTWRPQQFVKASPP